MVLDVLGDMSKPFPSFSGIYDTPVKAPRMAIAGPADPASGGADGEHVGMTRASQHDHPLEAS